MHDILTDLDGSEQPNTKHLTVPCISAIRQVRNCQRPESHGSFTQCSTSPRDGPRQHARNGTRHRSGTRRRSGVAVARPR